jgi:SAM-dependent methyltransferase
MPLERRFRPTRSNSSRDYLRAFVERAGASIPAGSRVLDAGAGDCRYAPAFAHAFYESADFLQVEGKVYADVTYVCDLSELPVEDARFDIVLCTQVLEHVPDPVAVLTELHRVLRPGGTLWISCPFFYEEHEAPFDFFRYTRFGLRRALEQGGFSDVQVEWLEGYFGTLAHQLQFAAAELPPWLAGYGSRVDRILYRVGAGALRPLLRAASYAFMGLDRAYRVTDRGMPKNYAAVAVRHP